MYGLGTAGAAALTFGKRVSWLPVVARTWARTCLQLSGIEIEEEGREHLAGRVPRVVTFNHQSLLDALVVCAILPAGSTAVVKKEAFRYPAMGPAISALGFLSIDREDRESARALLDDTARRIRDEQLTVFIAPEGTRAPTAALLPFKRGAFHLARQAGVPIVPMVIEGTRPLQPRGSFAIHSGSVRIRYLPPIQPEQWEASSPSDQADELHAVYVRELAMGALKH
jgi:putative phosphoserine phosphatase/1-acylglycerol-3-phosphate O-acyltransferase